MKIVTPEEYRKIAAKPKRNKYRAQRTTVNGVNFDSKGEADRFQQLQNLQRAGLISELTLHPTYPIEIDGRPLRAPLTKDGKIGRQYVVELDYSYIENGKLVTEDFKGQDNALSRLKRALVSHIYGIEVRVTRKAK